MAACAVSSDEGFWTSADPSGDTGPDCRTEPHVEPDVQDPDLPLQSGALILLEHWKQSIRTVATWRGTGPQHDCLDVPPGIPFAPIKSERVPSLRTPREGGGHDRCEVVEFAVALPRAV